jgi:hypothetical protein
MSFGFAARKRLWKWIGLAAPALALLAAAAWYWRTHNAGGDTPAHPRTSLSLQVARAGADYRVSWDASSPAVLAGTSGTLAVDDGSFHKDLALDREQLRSATLLYSPTTDDVTFTLTVVGARGDAVTESRRLLVDKLPDPAP